MDGSTDAGQCTEETPLPSQEKVAALQLSGLPGVEQQFSAYFFFP
jgi:hypothetical protein